jgi:TetR/AcrR family transcriptional regulator
MSAISNKPRAYKSGRIRVDNEAKILAAAELEFSERGFGGASMDRIATTAGIPRSNVHYYFNSKLELYIAVLTGVVDLWNQAFNQITPQDDPAVALAAYIAAKVQYSRSNPMASKIFASEIIHGAPNLSAYLNRDFRDWLGEKAGVIQSWIDSGKMDPVDPYYLIFLIWGATQHYADFEVQVSSVLGKKKLSKRDYDRVAANLTHIILKGCGIEMLQDPLSS